MKKKGTSEAATSTPNVDSVAEAKSVGEETMSVPFYESSRDDPEDVEGKEEEEEEDCKPPAMMSWAESNAIFLNPYPKIGNVTTDEEYFCDEPPTIGEMLQLLYEKYGQLEVSDGGLYHVFGKSMCL